MDRSEPEFWRPGGEREEKARPGKPHERAPQMADGEVIPGSTSEAR